MGYRISKKNFQLIFILLQVSSFHLPFFFSHSNYLHLCMSLCIYVNI
ncbi:hypothetical protein MGE_04758 [Candida albicans P75010]|nr:hypothetical protein MGE_04758 [Candida albicans P75010]